MSFYVTVSGTTASYQTPLYNLPVSNSAWYPAGIWNSLNYAFNVANSITISVYFTLPGSSQTYQEANSIFTITPSDYTAGNSAYPATINLVSSQPGADETKITLTVQWQ